MTERFFYGDNIRSSLECDTRMRVAQQMAMRMFVLSTCLDASAQRLRGDMFARKSPGEQEAAFGRFLKQEETPM